MLSTAKTLNGLAWVYLFAHRLDDARSGLADALAIARELRDEYWTATILFGLGYTYLQLLRYTEADECLADSLLIFRSLNDRLYEAMVLWFQSCLARDAGELAAAVAVSYTHLRAHETRHDLVCRLLLEKKKP